MDELVFIGLISLLWLVVVPIVILIKLSGLKGKVREQEEGLEWKIAQLEARLVRLETGGASGEDGRAEPAAAVCAQAGEALEALAAKDAQPDSPGAPVWPASEVPEPSQPESTGNTETAPEPLGRVVAQTALEAQPPLVSDPLAEAFKWVQGLARKSNMWVLGGTILLLFGLVFLAKLAIDAGWYTPSLRLASGALLGLTLLGFGWRSRESKPHLGQILQGGGVAAFYLVVIAAVKLHNMLPAAAGLPLLLVLVALGAALAVLQNAVWLAHVSMISGFLAPVLLSDGSGNYVALFSVFLILNLGVLVITHFRPWPHLCLTGFILTYGIGGLWGLRSYRPEMWTSVEPFLLAFTLGYLWLGWRLRAAAAAKAKAENFAPPAFPARLLTAGTIHYFLILATPALFFIYQMQIVGHVPFAMGLSGLGLGFVFLFGARRIWSGDSGSRLLDARIYFSLAVTGLNLALLFGGLDIGYSRPAMLFSLGVVWVMEGGLFICLTRGNQPEVRRYTRLLGSVLMLTGSVLSLVCGSEAVMENPAGQVAASFPLQAHILAGTLLAAAACLAAAWGCRSEIPDHSRFSLLKRLSANPPFQAGAYLLAGAWLTLGLYGAFAGFVFNLTWSALCLAAALCLTIFLRLRLHWPELRCLLLLPVFYTFYSLLYCLETFFSVIFARDYSELIRNAVLWDDLLHICAPIMLAALPPLVDGLVSGREDNPIRSFGKLIMPALIYAALLVCLPTAVYELIPAAVTYSLSDVWFMDIPLAFSLLLLAVCLLTAQSYAGNQPPLTGAQRNLAWWLCLALPLAQMTIWQVHALASPAWATPLPYIPLLNPLDLGAVLICLSLWLWRNKTGRLEPCRLNDAAGGLPGLAFICIMAFAAGHGLILRAMAVLVYGSVYVGSVLMEPAVQVGITLYWGICGFTLMLLGSKRTLRLVWICGALLLLAAAIKTVFIDTRNAATLARVAVYFGIGVLFICAGYFIPAPGGKKNRAQAEIQGE